jgi:hypothetical protein
VGVSCSSDIFIRLVVLLSLTADSSLVRQVDHVRFLSNPSQLTMYPSPYRATLCNVPSPFDSSPYRRQVEARKVRPEVQQTFENPNLPLTCSWMQFWFGLPLPLSRLLLFIFLSFRQSNADGTPLQMIHVVLQFVTACSSRYLEADSCTANRILWNLTFQCHVHTRPPPIGNPSHINPIRIICSCRFRTEFQIIVPSVPVSSKWSVARKQ